MKHFNVVIPKDDGVVEVYPMKECLRQNPDHPPALDRTSSAPHDPRSRLKKMVWLVPSTDSEVQPIMPGSLSRPLRLL